MNLAALYENASESGKVSQREKLILEYLPLVKRIVHRMASQLPSSIEIDDLNTAGIIGLIQAIDRFDQKRGIKLSTFASYRIRGAILEELRSRDILTRTDRKKVKSLEKTALAFEQKHGREPNDEEIAAELDMDIGEISNIRKVSAIGIFSLDEIGYETHQKRPQLIRFLADDSSNPLSLTRLKELQAVLGETIETLSKNEQMVVSLYYNEELTMKETGEVLGITESRVSQIHSQVIIKLRKKLYRKGVLG